MMDLSILIPCHRRDLEKLSQLCHILYNQALTESIELEILIHADNGQLTTGAKSNQLMQQANGKYLCRFDADDLPTVYYMQVLSEGIRRDVDCVSLMGLMTTNGEKPEIFEHSMKYTEYRTNHEANIGQVKYERFNNHLNCIRSSIAKQISYPDKTISEDTEFAVKLFKSGLLKTEYYDSRIIYNYLYTPNK